MATLLSPDYQWLWTLGLGVMLFFPVRQFIWVMSVRRAEGRSGPTDEAARSKLKRRASATSVLLCFVFSVVYVGYLFKDVK